MSVKKAELEKLMDLWIALLRQKEGIWRAIRESHEAPPGVLVEISDKGLDALHDYCKQAGVTMYDSNIERSPKKITMLKLESGRNKVLSIYKEEITE